MQEFQYNTKYRRNSFTTSTINKINHDTYFVLKDEAAERCSMFYRAPELFNPDLGSSIDERTDIWVNFVAIHLIKGSSWQ